MVGIGNGSPIVVAFAHFEAVGFMGGIGED